MMLADRENNFRLEDLFALSRARIVAVIHAFFDASFTKVHAGFTAIGGYIGPLDAWKAVEAKWENNLQYWGLDEFHLADIPHDLGHEKGSLCILSFANIIAKSNLHSLGAGLNDIDWSKNKDPDDLGHYHACLDMLFDITRQHMELEFPDDKLVVVVDRDSTNEDLTVALYAQYKKACRQFTSFEVGDRRTYHALQCADLAAGNWRKEWLAAEFGADSEVAGALTALGKRGRFVIRSDRARAKVAKTLSQRGAEGV